ncbi:4-hydroxyphenylacetate 3-hydroxylase N-terminal domain-containing protein [Rhodococcus pyridinivorans]|uniref:4-hydroxyphenylacetate 3-hydroxylase N-terminal domain-containing protein n=1 Tax=Rhodococcus pyridinivorans TaxID=103816 RepID=UPI001EE729DE|nr:4-hydroxyphenylacetate 3-hydroxylase N-terminal domain-containing protein [Rhodococcus pyridinivorans]
MRTGDEFRQGLADGRRVFYRGRRIDDVVSEPELALAVDHSAICYDIAADRPDLAVAEVDGEQVSAFYVAPSNLSLEAVKLQISRSFDPTRARDYVSVIAGIDRL